MTGASLRLRLLVGTLAWMAIAIALAAWGLRSLFQEHITQQLQAQLVMQLDHLSAAVDWEPGGKISIGPMAADARLEQPLSGLYWQIDELDPKVGKAPRAAVARSRSLWDQVLTMPPPPTHYPEQGYRVLQLRDNQGGALLAVVRPLELPEENAPRLRLVVAADTSLIAEPLHRFTRLLWTALGVLAVGLAVGVVLQLHYGLRPLALLRRRLAAVPGLVILDDENVPNGVDPFKVTLWLPRTGVSGIDLNARLWDLGHGPETADRDTLVLTITLLDEPEFVSHVTDVIIGLIEELRGDPRPGISAAVWALEPEVVVTPREAFFASRRRIDLADAVGEVSAEQFCPYPPGVPLIAPGERVTQAAVDALAVAARVGRVAYNSDPTMRTIEIVDEL